MWFVGKARPAVTDGARAALTDRRHAGAISDAKVLRNVAMVDIQIGWSCQLWAKGCGLSALVMGAAAVSRVMHR